MRLSNVLFLPQKIRIVFQSVRTALVLTSLFGALLSHNLWASAPINDPTRPIYQENGSSQIITNPILEEKKVILVQSILLGKNNRLAIVNGTLYKVGDQADELLVELIDKYYVQLSYKGQSIKAQLAKKLYVNKRTGEISE